MTVQAAGPAARPSEATLEAVRTLVGFPTVSRDSNLGLIEWVRDLLARRGVPARLTYDAAGGKANLFATLGEGPGAGIVLSGHTDVVPVDGQDWDSDPFTLREADGRLYGRGAADMKGFIGAALAQLERFLAAGLPHPVHLALSYDEEVGCLGVRGLLRDLRQARIQPAGCIVGEPTGMQAVVGHKGLVGYRCRIRGREAHSALTPQGVNAVEYAARLVVYIRMIADRLRALEQRHFGYDVPHSTLNTGLIEGGIAINVVPRDCSFVFECRYLPSTDPQAVLDEIRVYAERELLPQMREVAPEAAIAFEQLAELPAFEAEPGQPLTDFARKLAASRLGAQSGAQEPGAGFEPAADKGRYVAFGTEAGLFQRAGIPTVLCGPGHIAQAHKPNEWIALDQLAQCEQFMLRLAQGDPAFGAR
ncbi:acetylornithine deacetylase [Orrella sp. JC864]|uniref:acetylornithine deacetylase n=1 Tax=Orrella sp. JC864 TaxID=3120298 RepID=UPI00300BCC4F